MVLTGPEIFDIRQVYAMFTVRTQKYSKHEVRKFFLKLDQKGLYFYLLELYHNMVSIIMTDP